MDSVQTQTLSIQGDGGGEAYIDFCNGQLCVSVVIEGKQANFHSIFFLFSKSYARLLFF